MATEVYLLRHAQTSGNVTGERLYNPDLTPHGERQVLRIVAALRPEGLTLVLASPLRRALATAAPLAAACRVPLRAWNDLVECNGWDPYAGSPRSELARLWPQAELEPGMPEGGWTYPGPEGQAEVLQRAARAAGRIAALPPGTRVGVVAHGTFNGLLLAAWLGLPPGAPAAFAQDNAAVSQLCLDGRRVTVRRLNDTGHLG